MIGTGTLWFAPSDRVRYVTAVTLSREAIMIDWTPKQRARQAVDALPDDATLEGAIERLALLIDIERGLADADAGRTVSHESVLERFAPKVS